MNDNMVEYIRKYLNEGHSLEKIRQFLLSQGYPDKEIKECALAAMQGEIKKIRHSKTWIILAVILVIILILGGVGYYFQEDVKNIVNSVIGEKNITEENIGTNDNTPITDNTQTDNIPPPDEIFTQTNECDMNCLIQASATCQPQSTSYTASMDLFGMLVSTNTYYEIRKSETCKLYMRTDDYFVSISDETRQYLLSEGVSEEEIEMQILEMEKYKYEMIGKEGICVFNNLENMRLYLEKTRDGTFSGSASCGLADDTNCSMIITNEGTTENGCEDLQWDCEYDGDYTLGECTGTMFTGEPVNI